MKKFYNFAFIILLPFLFTSCDKDSSSSSSSQNKSVELSAFDGFIKNGNNDIPSTGVVEISNSKFTFMNEYGSLNGTVNLIQDDDATYYEATVEEGNGDGIFENTGGLQGEIYNNYISITGTSTSGQTINIDGSLMTVEESNAQWEADRTKASIVFTNLESCHATITLNNETIGPLQTHWREGGYCNTPYDAVLQFPRDVDNQSSYLSCHDLTLDMLDGSTKTFNICDIAYFIVDKENSYNYTVSWDNGETTSGSISPLTGGQKKFVCLTNSGEECEYEEEEEEEETLLISSVSINIDYANSFLPTGDENRPPYIDQKVYKIVPTTLNNGDAASIVVIGDRYSPTTPDGQSDTKIKMYIRHGIANGTYTIENWDGTSSPIAVEVDFGSNGIPYSSTHYTTSGEVSVSNYDPVSKTCTFTFTAVNVVMSGGQVTYNMKFSGEVIGTFVTE